MCGLLGVSSPKNVTIPISKLKILYLMNETRGGHACGFSDGDLTVKSTEKSFDFVNNKNFPKEVTSAIAHTRFATHGNKKDEKCAHPFPFPDFVGAHNGTIQNFEELQELFDTDYEVDSEFIYYLVKNYGLKKVLPLFQGSLALSYIERNTKIINLYRFGRSLFFGEIGESLYYSSESRFLKAINCTNIREVQPHTIYRLRNGKIISSKQVKKKLKPTEAQNKGVIKIDLKHKEGFVKALNDDEVYERWKEMTKEKPKSKRRPRNTGLKLVENCKNPPKREKWGESSNPVDVPAYAKAKRTTFGRIDELTFWWFDPEDAYKVHVYVVGQASQSIYNFGIQNDVSNFETEHPGIQDIVETEFNEIIESRSLIDEYKNEEVYN